MLISVGIYLGKDITLISWILTVPDRFTWLSVLKRGLNLLDSFFSLFLKINIFFKFIVWNSTFFICK